MDRKLGGAVLACMVLAACYDGPHAHAEAADSTDWRPQDRDADYEAQEDDPATSNDESNDQPVGLFGDVTLCVSTPHNGESYTLDVAVDEDRTVSEIYFPKGGNVDLYGCQLEDDLTGLCEDEAGRDWQFDGEC